MSVLRGYVNGGNYYSNIAKPVKIDCTFVVDASNGNGLGIRSLKSNGYVRNAFMHTSSTPGTNDGMLNPNPAVGFALLQMKYNFNSYIGGFQGFVSPTAGSSHVINSTALSIGNPYVIATVGAVAEPSFTVAAVADSSGSLIGTYFKASDGFSNNYVFYNVVGGVGTPPSLTGVLNGYVAVPVTFASSAANTVVGAALATAMAGVNNSNSWLAVNSGHTVTVTSKAGTNIVLSPGPVDVNTGFTISAVSYVSLAADWQHVGVPLGFTPNVGLGFIAKTTGGATGSGTVLSPGISGITSIEVVGDPNQTIANSNIASNGGSLLLVQFLAPTSTSTTTLLPTAPAQNSVVGMSFFFDGSSSTIDGL